MSIVVNVLTLAMIERIKTVMFQIKKEWEGETVFADGSRYEIVEKVQRLEFRAVHQHDVMVVKL